MHVNTWLTVNLQLTKGQTHASGKQDASQPA
jgi:hypothetical protein